MRKMAFILILLVCSGCATEGKFREKCDSWLGQKSDDLVMSLGPPQSQVALSNGNTLMEWQHMAGAVSYGSFNRYSAVSYGGVLFCTVDFILDQSQVVQSYSYRGNYCVSR